MVKKLLLILIITANIPFIQAQDYNLVNTNTHSFILGVGYLRNTDLELNGASLKFGYQLHFSSSRFFIGADFITDFMKSNKRYEFNGPDEAGYFYRKFEGYDIQFDFGFHLIRKKMFRKRKLNVNLILSNGIYLLKKHEEDRYLTPKKHTDKYDSQETYTTILIPCFQMDFSYHISSHHTIGLSLGVYPKMSDIFDLNMSGTALLRPILYYKFSLWTDKYD